MVTGGAEKLRAAEKAAKEKKLRLWKDYVPSAPQVNYLWLLNSLILHLNKPFDYILA